MIKKRFVIVALFCLTFAACSPFGCQTSNDGFAHKRTSVAPGVKYEHLRRIKTVELEPLSIHVLAVDPSKASLKLMLAKDHVLGKEKTTAMAARSDAVAAINGGFFIINGDYQGDLDGLFIQDGVILSDPAEKRSSFGFCTTPKGQEAVFEQFELQSLVSPKNGEPTHIDGINREPAAGETIMLTPQFGGSAAITPDTSIIVGNGTAGSDVSYELKSLRSGRNFPFQPCSFTSAGPTLVLSDEVIQDYTAESPKFVGDFIHKRHPRTAVGQKKDGTLLFVVVDGRQPLLSAGMTLPELAEFMKKQGAVSAYNLDGGGSSTMVVKSAIVNSPSDKAGERPTSDAIVIKSR